jgi:hypothetical protein
MRPCTKIRADVFPFYGNACNCVRSSDVSSPDTPSSDRTLPDASSSAGMHDLGEQDGIYRTGSRPSAKRPEKAMLTLGLEWM